MKGQGRLLVAIALVVAFSLAVMPTSARADSYPAAAVAGEPQFVHMASMRTAVGQGARGLAPQPDPIWDEQMGLTYSDNFTSLALNVTAVVQLDANQYGPVYLLNGLSDKGFWYQIGVSYNWPIGGGPFSGFAMSYEVFNSLGNSIFPTNGGGGLDDFSTVVNDGDLVGLSLTFSGGNVAMTAYDWNTTATATESYSAVGAHVFLGLSGNSNSNGFFTGPMTEWWHVGQYAGGTNRVVYSDNAVKTSGWLWADEWDPDNGTAIFSVEHFANFTDPAAFRYLGYYGCTMAANSTLYMTGGLIQAPITLSFLVQGGGSGYSAPQVHYTSNATQLNASVGSPSSVIYADLNSIWTMDTGLGGGSASEAWRTGQNVTNPVYVEKSLSYTYYHQFNVTFGLSVVGSSGYSTFSVTSSQFGNRSLIPVGTSAFVDAQSAYTYPSPLPGSTSTEGWYPASSSIGLIVGAGTVAPVYYDEIRITESYAVQGGQGSASPPQILAQVLGANVSTPMTSSVSSVWADRGTSYSVGATLNGSGPAERWVSAAGATGVLSSPVTLSLTYYHQFLVNWTYSTITSPPATLVAGWPVVNGTQMGTFFTQSFGSGNTLQTWLDSGTSWGISSSLNPTDGSWRLVTSASTAGTVTSASQVSAPYYGQVPLTVSFSIVGGGNPAAPQMNFTSMGKGSAATLTSSPTPLWADVGTTYSIPTFIGGTSTERWSAQDQSVVSTAAAAKAVAINYSHQFYLTITVNIKDGGTVPTSDGWVNAGGSLDLTAVPNPEWGFASWQGLGSGSYSGTLQSTTLQVNSAVSEEAVFSPSLKVSVVGPGSVTVSSPVVSQPLTEGTTTLYPSLGSTAVMTATPSSFFYEFEGWSGMSQSSASQVTLTVNVPQFEKATFGIDWLHVLIPIIAVVIALLLAFMALRRRRKTKPSSST